MAGPDLSQVADSVAGLAGSRLTGSAANAVEAGYSLFKQYQNTAGNSGFQQANPSGARDALMAALSRPDALTSIYWYADLPVINTVSLGWEYVEEASLPMIEFEVVSNFRAGKMFHFPTKYNLSNMTLKFFEDVRGSTTAYFQEWYKLIRDPDTGLFQPSSLFKKPIRITVLDIAQYTVMFMEYTGCWPTRIDTYNMQSATAERITPSVEFAVDDLLVKVGKFQSSQIPSVVDTIGNNFPQTASRLPSVFPQAFTSSDLGSLPIG